MDSHWTHPQYGWKLIKTINLKHEQLATEHDQNNPSEIGLWTRTLIIFNKSTEYVTIAFHHNTIPPEAIAVLELKHAIELAAAINVIAVHSE